MFVLGAAILFGTACEKINGEGPAVTETRATGNFSGLDVRMDADVHVTQSPVYKVEVTAQQNVLNVMETYISGNKLVLKFRNNVRVRNYSQVIINVSAPNLGSLYLSGSGDVRVSGVLNPLSMELGLSGSGSMHVEQINTGRLDASISGSGSIHVENGTATEERLKISGSGDMQLANVQTQEATTSTSGSGSIRLHATQKLDVSISGSGDVYYKGNPVINTNISGSGRVIHY